MTTRANDDPKTMTSSSRFSSSHVRIWSSGETVVFWSSCEQILAVRICSKDLNLLEGHMRVCSIRFSHVSHVREFARADSHMSFEQNDQILTCHSRKFSHAHVRICSDDMGEFDRWFYRFGIIFLMVIPASFHVRAWESARRCGVQMQIKILRSWLYRFLTVIRKFPHASLRICTKTSCADADRNFQNLTLPFFNSYSSKFSCARLRICSKISCVDADENSPKLALSFFDGYSSKFSCVSLRICSKMSCADANLCVCEISQDIVSKETYIYPKETYIQTKETNT